MDISIIMPVWNGWKFLDAAIDSLLQQAIIFSRHKLEVIFINDGSSDGRTPNKLKDMHRYLKANSRYSPALIELDRNEGISVARNIGVKHARGKYICYLDCDDLYSPTYLRNQHSLLEETEADIAVSSCEVERLDEDGFGIVTRLHPELSAGAGKERMYLQNHRFAWALQIMHTKSIFDKCVEKFGHGFVPGLVGREDYVLWRRMADLDAKFVYTGKSAGIKKHTPTGQHRTMRFPDSQNGFLLNYKDQKGPTGQYLDEETM